MPELFSDFVGFSQSLNLYLEIFILAENQEPWHMGRKKRSRDRFNSSSRGCQADNWKNWKVTKQQLQTASITQ